MILIISLMMNRYKTSVHYVDSIVKQVLNKLKETGDAENTFGHHYWRPWARSK